MTEITVIQRASQALNSTETRVKLAALAKQSERIQEVRDADSRQECHAALMRLKDMRVNVEKTGKEARADATAYSKAVIKEEADLIAIISPEETRLKKLRDDFDNAKRLEAEAKAKAERERIEAEHAAKLAAEKAEADRIAKEQADQLARERAEFEAQKAAETAKRAEEQRLADAQAALLKAQQDEIAKREKAIADAEAEAERKRLDAEAAERRRIADEDAAKARAEKERQEQEAAEQRRKAQEAREAEEATKRREEDARAQEAHLRRIQAIREGADSKGLLGCAIDVYRWLVANDFGGNEETVALGFAITAEQEKAA